MLGKKKSMMMNDLNESSPENKNSLVKNIDQILIILKNARNMTFQVRRAISQLKLVTALHQDDYKDATNEVLMANDIHVISDEFPELESKLLLHQALSFISHAITNAPKDAKLYCFRANIVTSLISKNFSDHLKTRLLRLRSADLLIIKDLPKATVQEDLVLVEKTLEKFCQPSLYERASNFH